MYCPQGCIMNRLALSFLILFTFSCGLFQSTITIKNETNLEIMFYLNGLNKENILPDESKTYDVESGTHSLLAMNTNLVKLASETVKIRFGHDAA